MAVHCIPILAAITEMLNNDTAAALKLSGITPSIDNAGEIWDSISRELPVELRATAQAEFESLPFGFLPAMLLAWQTAERAGVDFVITSEPPELPIDAARDRRVSVRTDYRESSVRMVVSHVHGYHAEWMTREPVASAST